MSMKLYAIMITVAILSSSILNASEVILNTGGCFKEGTPKLQYSSRTNFPILYLSGFKMDLDKMAKYFGLNEKEKTNIEILKSVLAKRVTKDRCKNTNIIKGDYSKTCVGKVLDGKIIKENNRFYPRTFTCLEVVKCNMTKKEKTLYNDSVIDETDLVIPKRCRQ